LGAQTLLTDGWIGLKQYTVKPVYAKALWDKRICSV